MKPFKQAAIRRSAIVAALMALQGCTAAPPAASLYQRLGGLPAITSVVDQAVDRHAADPRTRRSFEGVNLKTLKTSIVEQACEATGGPCKYRGDTMVKAHTGLEITAEEFDTALGHINETLDQLRVATPEKEEFLSILRPMRGDIVGR